MASSTQSTVLVTGASSGMGRACALHLSKEGFTVFAAVRNDRDIRAVTAEGSPHLIPIILDVTDERTIAQAETTIREAVGTRGLTGLVNNAGVAVTGPLELVPVPELRRQYEVNVLGQVAVIQAFLPLIRAARGRIVNVGSVGARFALPFGGPLNSSKSALESINDSLRMELWPWGIRVVLVSPGSIRTSAEEKLVADSEAALGRYSVEGQARYAGPYRAFVRSLLALESRGASPDIMAEVVRRALTARRPKRRYPVGPKSRLLPFLFTTLPAGVTDRLRMALFHVYRPFGSVSEPTTSAAELATREAALGVAGKPGSRERGELKAIPEELAGVLQNVDPTSLDELQGEVQSAARVYVAGAGRSGLMMSAFAMRLMHMGMEVHVVGEVTTPAFARGDLLVIGSGSGETGALCVLARKAKALGGRIGLVTIVPGSTLGHLADAVVRIDAPSPKAVLEPGRAPPTSVQLMGSLFEQALLLTLDAVALRLAGVRGQRADALFARHANLE